MIPYVIYGLAHPRTGRIRYVGKSKLAVRARIKGGYRNSPVVMAWLNRLKGQGLRPSVVILEQNAQADWKERERAWIQTLKYDGHRLLNTCGGGNGSHAHAGLPAPLQALLGRVPDERIATMAGLCREAVGYHRRAKSIPAAPTHTRIPGSARFKKGFRPFNKLTIVDAISGELGVRSDAELADRLGVRRSTIARRRRGMGLPACRGLRHRGDRHAKVTPRAVVQIRTSFKPGQPGLVEALARRHGVSPSAIYRIVKRISWAHI